MVRILVAFAILHLGLSALADDASELLALKSEIPIYVLQKDTRVFHWTVRTNVTYFPAAGPIDPFDSGVQKNISDRAKRFWDLGIEDIGNAGNGLYAAADPVVSADYGGTNPVLYSILLKAGTKAIDANVPISQKLLDFMRAKGFETTGMYSASPYFNWNRIFAAYNNPNHRNFLRLVFKTFGIQMKLYSWTGFQRVNHCKQLATSAPPKPKDFDAYAFVIVDPAVIDFSRTYVFTPLTDDPRVSKEFEMVKTYFTSSSSQNTFDADPWGDDEITEFNKWVETNHVSCGKESHLNLETQP